MKYKVTVSTLFVDGVKYKRGDIVETDQELGTRAELLTDIEPDIEAPKPKRKRRTKAEIEAEKALEVPKFGGEDIA